MIRVARIDGRWQAVEADLEDYEDVGDILHLLSEGVEIILVKSLEDLTLDLGEIEMVENENLH